MNALFVLIPIALGLGAAGLAAFFWSMRDGQYDDMDGAAVRILIENENEDRPAPRIRPHDHRAAVQWRHCHNPDRARQ